MGEALSAKDIERAEFSVSLRGYDRDEVEAFLRDVAKEHRRLSEALNSSRRNADKPYHSLGADMGELLQHAKDSADQLKRKGEEEAKQIRQEAKKDAAATREKAERDAEEIRKAADYDASERIKEAERRVRQLMEAEAEARQGLGTIRAEMKAVMERIEHAEVALAGQEPQEEQTAGPEATAATAEQAQASDEEQPAAGGEKHQPAAAGEQQPAATDEQQQTQELQPEKSPAA